VRALRGRGYPPEDASALAPELAEIFEEGIADEHGELMISFEGRQIGSVD